MKATLQSEASKNRGWEMPADGIKVEQVPRYDGEPFKNFREMQFDTFWEAEEPENHHSGFQRYRNHLHALDLFEF